MYLNYYGLREPPFELTSNPKYLFFTEQHREALSVLEYGLSSVVSGACRRDESWASKPQ